MPLFKTNQRKFVHVQRHYCTFNSPGGFCRTNKENNLNIRGIDGEEPEGKSVVCPATRPVYTDLSEQGQPT